MSNDKPNPEKPLKWWQKVVQEFKKDVKSTLGFLMKFQIFKKLFSSTESKPVDQFNNASQKLEETPQTGAPKEGVYTSTTQIPSPQGREDDSPSTAPSEKEPIYSVVTKQKNIPTKEQQANEPPPPLPERVYKKEPVLPQKGNDTPPPRPAAPKPTFPASQTPETQGPKNPIVDGLKAKFETLKETTAPKPTFPETQGPNTTVVNTLKAQFETLAAAQHPKTPLPESPIKEKNTDPKVKVRGR